MTTTTKQNGNFSADQSKTAIDTHKKTVTHLEAAAKSHLEAIKHHEEDNHDKATKSTIKANEYLTLANETHKEASKLHNLKD